MQLGKHHRTGRTGRLQGAAELVEEQPDGRQPRRRTDLQAKLPQRLRVIEQARCAAAIVEWCPFPFPAARRVQ